MKNPRNCEGLNWLPFAGTYRTLCMVPPVEVRALFESVRGYQTPP